MRPAIEVWWEAGKAAANCVFGSMEMPDVVAAAVIEADRAELVREIVQYLQQLDATRDESSLIGWTANQVQARFGGTND